MDQPSDGKTSSTFSGNAGEVVQARDISGGVHLHQRGSVPRTPRQLPGSAAGFVNRRQELKALNTALASGGHPLTVVVGTAGVGKTSLVLRWAHDIRDRFPDGQLYVNLRGYDPGLPITPSRALESFLSALGIPRTEIPSGTDERSALYRSLLAGRRMLVVLDNAATVPQIRPLLPGTPESLVLATSRNRLSGLVARDGAHRITLGLLNEPDAIELLGKVAAWPPPEAGRHTVPRTGPPLRAAAPGTEHRRRARRKPPVDDTRRSHQRTAQRDRTMDRADRRRG